MTPPQRGRLAFSEALADANRVMLGGRLAREPHTVEQLAAAFGVASSTVWRCLRRFVPVTLMHARADGRFKAFPTQAKADAGRGRHLAGIGGTVRWAVSRPVRHAVAASAQPRR